MITLYEKTNFQGLSTSVGEGDTRFPSSFEFDDFASSIRVPSGYCVILYENANEYGPFGIWVDLLEDCADLSIYGFDKKTSYIKVFRSENDAYVWVRNCLRDGNFIPAHWERKRASGLPKPAVGSVAVVSPPVPAPLSPQSHDSSGPVVREHQGGEGPGAIPPSHPSGWGSGIVHDHRDSKVKHVFVLMLENRSFDHMLGFSGITGTDAATGEPTSINGLTGNESNLYGSVKYTVSRGAPNVAPHDPGHGFPAVLEQLCGDGAQYESGNPYPPINNLGFVSNYAKSHPELPDGNMKCFTPEQVPVITALAKEFLVCDKWFCSMPGPTEPNRWFVHAATAGTLDESPEWHEYLSILNPFGGFEFERGNIFQHLRKANVKFRIYAGDSFPNVALLDGVSRTFDVDEYDEDFAEDVASPSYDAAYTFIEPSYDAFNHYKGGSSQHPLGNVAAGELLIKKTYETLRSSPIWESSLLVILYDEHGGFYDHVPPPSAQATGSKGRKFGFTFDQLGPRVPAVIVSPLIPKNMIDHRQYEHSSIISTLIDLFHLDPLTRRSSASSDFKHLASLKSPRMDAPMSLPDPMNADVSNEIKTAFNDLVLEKPNVLLMDGDPNGAISLVIRSGVAQHLEITPPAEHEAIQNRVKAIRTRGEALQYLKEVSVLVKSARTAAGVQRSATVRIPDWSFKQDISNKWNHVRARPLKDE